MAKTFCKYHPDAPARWTCRHCLIDFCKNCIQADNEQRPTCPVCGDQVESLGAGNLIRPFWHRIPQFFLYPFQFPPLLFMLLLMVLSIIVNKVPTDIMPFGVLLELAMVMLFVKYAYVVLEHTAQGYLQAQRIRGKLLTENLETPFKQLFIVFLFFIGLSELSALEDEVLLHTGMFFMALVFPASVMVLAVEHRLLRAINPLTLLDTIRRIGGAYFIMCLFLLVLLMSAMQATNVMAEYLPASIYMPVGNFIVMYFTLIMFNMMGYVLYQYHEELGYSIQQEYSETGNTGYWPHETEPALREIEILFQEGKLGEVRTRLIHMIQDHPGNMQYRERLHRLLLASNDIEGLRIYTADYIGRLMLDNRPSEAIRVFTDCYKLDKNFKFGNGRQRFAMAQLLNKNGQARAALNLLTDLHVDFPGYEGIPDAYLLVARILCESFNEDGKARQILEFLQNKYPDHPRMTQVKEYMTVVTGLGQR
jgi:hypothetical protein